MEKADELVGHNSLSLLQLRLLLLPSCRGGGSVACVWRLFTITEGAFWSYWQSKISSSFPSGHKRCSWLLLTWITTPQNGVYSCLGSQGPPVWCKCYWHDILSSVDVTDMTYTVQCGCYWYDIYCPVWMLLTWHILSSVDVTDMTNTVQCGCYWHDIYRPVWMLLTWRILSSLDVTDRTYCPVWMLLTWHILSSLDVTDMTYTVECGCYWHDIYCPVWMLLTWHTVLSLTQARPCTAPTFVHFDDNYYYLY
jgi:hypothetical protein